MPHSETQQINPQGSFHPEYSDVEPENLDSDTEDVQSLSVEDLSTETLLAAYPSIARSWDETSVIAGQRVPTLRNTVSHSRVLRVENLLPLDIFGLSTYATSGLRFSSLATLQSWEFRIKGLAKINEAVDEEAEEVLAFESDNLELTLESTALHPIMGLIANENIEDRHAQAGDDPSGAVLATIVSQYIPLNRKQRMIVERVLSSALAWKDCAYDASKRTQMLLYIGGVGGVGKSQVVKGVVAGMDLIRRKAEVILMGTTGVAADIIGGNIYHTSLGISICKAQKSTVPAPIRNLWARKTIMIVDEISMLDLSMLFTVNNQCKIARAFTRSSPDLFGGLPIVIFMGYFHQFSPVRGRALWKEPSMENDEEANGQAIWHRFTNVIILD